MPPTFPLPADTQVAGLGNPPADVNKLADVFSHSVLQRVFYIDQYGADPTGATLSDTAWTNCYSDASSAVLAHSGALIMFGPGTYLFSVSTVAVGDSRIGLKGAGRYCTTIMTTGSGGSLVKISGATAGGANAAASCGGFTVYGWAAGNGTNGLEYGDRSNGMLTDVTATGFGGSGSRGFWFHDTTGISEGSFMVLNADQNTVNYCFDGTTGSFDYSHFFFHMVASTAGGNSAVGLQVVNGMHINGSYLQLSGNASATTGLTTTVVQVGVSTSDTCHVQGNQMSVMVECDTSAGTVKDVLIQGVSANAGIINCMGTFFFQNSTASYTIGTVTSPAVFKVAGFLIGPTFAGHGSFTTGSNGATFSVYSG